MIRETPTIPAQPSSEAPPSSAPSIRPAPLADSEREPIQHLRPEVALAHLTRAITAARALGLPTLDAEKVRAGSEARLGYPADAYVLALVGGTGVGKSSLLNALAGEPVSVASARRPTTSEAVAWVPHDARVDIDELLTWLGVREIHEHEDGGVHGVAILDLPDIDSVDQAHRDRVEVLLPRVDAVVWVTDLEKYHDAVLYDDFLRTWIPRLDRQAIVVNKSDRLRDSGIDDVRRDLQHDVATRLAVAGRRPLPVIVTSALDGQADLGELRRWLGKQVEAKRVVRDRIVATVSESIVTLAREAGVDPTRPAQPFLPPTARRAASQAVTFAVLRQLGMAALEAQAINAIRARARARGTGPIGLVTSAMYRLSGRESAVADPNRYLARWREHGPLAPAVDAARRALVGPVRNAPPAVRPVLAASVEPTGLERRLAIAVDRAVGRRDRQVPSSRAWRLIGVLQTIATTGIVLSAAWLAIWIVARPPVESLVLPVLGPIPMPFVTLVVSLLAGYLLVRLLGWHAGWVGRRWAAQLRHEIEEAVEREMTGGAFEQLDALEEAREALWRTARQVVPITLR
jgi:50S ribosome-binding GTPase